MRYKPAQSHQQTQSESGGGMMYLVTTLIKSKSKLSVKLSKLFESSDVLKVISEGCIVMFHNMAKAHLPITLNS